MLVDADISFHGGNSRKIEDHLRQNRMDTVNLTITFEIKRAACLPGMLMTAQCAFLHTNPIALLLCSLQIGFKEEQDGIHIFLEPR